MLCWCADMKWHDMIWLGVEYDSPWPTLKQTPAHQLPTHNHWFNQLRCKTPKFLSNHLPNTTKLISLSSQIARDWHIGSSQSRSMSDTINITGLWLLFQRFHDMSSAYQICLFVYTSSTPLSLQNKSVDLCSRIFQHLSSTFHVSPQQDLGNIICIDNYDYDWLF